MTTHQRPPMKGQLLGATAAPLAPRTLPGSRDAQPCLSVADVAGHYRLSEPTVSAMLREDRLTGVRIGRLWRLCWDDVWAGEDGPRPQGTRCDALRRPLLRKRDLAVACGVSVRTVERWLAEVLPTRNVGRGCRCVRIAPADAELWLAGRFGLVIRLGEV